MRKIRALVIGCAVAGLFVPSAPAAELKPATVAAFDRYIRATEARMDDDSRHDRFFVMDRLPGERRQGAYARLRQGQIHMEEPHSLEDGHAIHIPSGLIHHWAGVIFLLGATFPQALAVLRDYENHQNVYMPDVRRSRLLEHSGNKFKVYLQLYRRSIVTVVLNATFDVEYISLGSTRSLSKSYSTRIAEVRNAGKPDERELPVGRDHGYMWRLYSYWRIEEKDGGVYVQNESVALSRTVPPIFAWLVNPLLRSIPKAVLSHLLQSTRRAVLKENPPAGHSPSL